MFSFGYLFQPFSQQKQPSLTPIATVFDPSSYEKEATVIDVIQQGKSWWIRYQGTTWKARSEQVVTLNPGDDVYVVGRHNTLLFIMPAVSRVPVLN
jgi:membrane protein implicated in regulation of membrane protease activity